MIRGSSLRLVAMELLRMFVRNEDFRAGRFPIDPLAPRIARPERRLMKICDAHESFVDANRDATDRRAVTRLALHERKRVQPAQ